MSKEIVCDRCGKSSRDLKGYGKLNQVKAVPFRGIEEDFFIGEVKGSDINTLLMNMNTGHKCMTTFHASDKSVSILKELLN